MYSASRDSYPYPAITHVMLKQYKNILLRINLAKIDLDQVITKSSIAIYESFFCDNIHTNFLYNTYFLGT